MDPATRQRIVDVARGELSTWGKRPRVPEYWRVSGMPPETQANWCGAFALWVLRTAGVAVPSDWIPGDGFIGPSHLRVTNDPQPGDLLYKDSPWQHQSVVVARNGNTVTTIDGNSPLISENQHQLGALGTIYYSIGSLPSAPMQKGNTTLEVAVAFLVTLAAGLGYRKWRQRKAA